MARPDLQARRIALPMSREPGAIHLRVGTGSAVTVCATLPFTPAMSSEFPVPLHKGTARTRPRRCTCNPRRVAMAGAGIPLHPPPPAEPTPRWTPRLQVSNFSAFRITQSTVTFRRGTFAEAMEGSPRSASTPRCRGEQPGSGRTTPDIPSPGSAGARPYWLAQAPSPVADAPPPCAFPLREAAHSRAAALGLLATAMDAILERPFHAGHRRERLALAAALRVPRRDRSVLSVPSGRPPCRKAAPDWGRRWPAATRMRHNVLPDPNTGPVETAAQHATPAIAWESGLAWSHEGDRDGRRGRLRQRRRRPAEVVPIGKRSSNGSRARGAAPSVEPSAPPTGPPTR